MIVKIQSKRHKRVRAPKDCEKGLPYTEVIIDGKRVDVCNQISENLFTQDNKLTVRIDSSIIHSRFLRSRILTLFASKLLNVPDRYLEGSMLEIDNLNVDTLILGSGIGGLSALENCNSCIMITSNTDDEFFYDPTIDQEIVKNVKNIIKQKSDKIVYGEFIGKYDEGLVFRLNKKYYIIKSRNLIIATGSRYIPPVFPNNDLPGIVSRRMYLKYRNLFKDPIIIGSTDLAIRTALVQRSTLLVKSRTAHFSKQWIERAEEKGIEIIEVNNIFVKRNGKKLKINYDGVEKDVDSIVFSIVRQPRIEPIANLGYQYTFYSPLHIYVPKHEIEGTVTENTKIVGGARSLYDEKLSYLSGKIIYGKEVDEFIGELKKTYMYDFYTNSKNSKDESPYFFGNDGYICECEDIGVKEVLKKLAKGYTDVESIKRVTGACTGYCQGKVCSYLVGSLTRSNNLITFRTPLYSLW